MIFLHFIPQIQFISVGLINHESEFESSLTRNRSGWVLSIDPINVVFLEKELITLLLNTYCFSFATLSIAEHRPNGAREKFGEPRSFKSLSHPNSSVHCSTLQTPYETARGAFEAGKA